MSETFSMTKEKVIETPKDTVLEGIIIEVEKTTWANIISPDKLDKFENPKEDIIVIKFETKFEDRNLKGEESFRFYEAPMSNSKLGLFLNKYDKLEVGVKIKVDYNGEGFPNIRIK